MNKILYFLYKTTNKINGKYYYGMHSTKKLDDGYMGSGKYLKRSINKYGVENFTIEILEFFNTREEMCDAESKLITESVLNDNNCMNIRLGGFGGFSSEEQRNNAIKSNEKQRILREEDNEWVIRKYENSSISHKKTYEEGRRERVYFFDRNNIKHNDVTKDKISKSKKGKYCGVENSQYGTCWITKDKINKKVEKDKIDSYINDGWVSGKWIESKIDIEVLLKIEILNKSGVSLKKLSIDFGIPKTTLIDNLKKLKK